LRFQIKEQTTMAVKPIPDGYHTVTPYMVVSGVARLIDFLKRAFDAKELHATKDSSGTIRHAEIQIGDSRVMLGEANEQWKAMPSAIYLYVSDADAAYRGALAAGATSIMEPADQFYGDRHGGVTDPTGNMWWIATHIEDMPPAEMERRAKAYMK
jgi:PhnB protein